MVVAKNLTGIVKGYENLTHRASGSYSLNPGTEETVAIPRKTLARIRPKFNIYRFQAKSEDLADILLPHGYQMRFNDNHYQFRGPEQVVVELDVGENGRTVGSLEVYLGKRYEANMASSVRFICSLAEYAGVSIGTRQDLIRQAEESIPDIASPNAIQKISFSFINGATKVVFGTKNHSTYVKADTDPYLKFA